MFGAHNTYSSASSGSSSQQRIQLELNERGQVVGDNAGKLKTELGMLVRTHIPITYTNWKYLPKNYKEDIWTDIREQVKSIQLNQGENIGCSLEDDPLGKVFGKDTRGHVRGIGSLVSRTQIEASLPALAKVLSLEIENSGLASRMTSMESHMVTMTEQMQEMMALFNGYMGMAPPMTQGNIRNVGSTSNSAITIRSKSAEVNCELLSLVLDKHRELCHGHEVDELEEKVLPDEIVNYNAALYLGKQGGATCF